MYKKVLLKLSGEVLAGNGSFGIAPEQLMHYTTEIEKARKAGVEMAVVIGGGNIWRGTQAKALGIDPAAADYMGMLATAINSIALHSLLLQKGIPARLMSQVPMQPICEAYSRSKALQYLKKRCMLIIAAGLGKPYFTTDSAASLTAIELGAEVLLKGTKVDGIYPLDPGQGQPMTPYTSIGVQQVMEKKLKVMDMTALTLCANQNLPIIVYNATKPDVLMQVIQKKKVGTRVCM